METPTPLASHLDHRRTGVPERGDPGRIGADALAVEWTRSGPDMLASARLKEW